MTIAWRDRLILAFPFIAVALLAVVTPSDDGPTICPFALFTGTACPGCGMTRAAGHIIRGDVGTAMSYHPLIPLAVLAIVGGWSWFALRLTGKVPPMSQRTLNVILIAATIALVAVWGVRAVTGTLPPV